MDYIVLVEDSRENSTMNGIIRFLVLFTGREFVESVDTAGKQYSPINYLHGSTTSKPFLDTTNALVR